MTFHHRSVTNAAMASRTGLDEWPWSVTIDPSRVRLTDVYQWCRSRWGPIMADSKWSWVHTDKWFFKDLDDAVLFEMTWSPLD